MSVLHQSMRVFKTGLSILSDGWAKYKEKVPDVSDPNQNVETTSNSKLKFTELKYLFIKRLQKTSQTVCIANTGILKLRVFSGGYHFRLWVFTWTGEYF